MTRSRQSYLLILLAALLLTGGLPVYGQHAIGRQPFQRVWIEQDGPIADEIETSRSWTWGPQPISPVIKEKMIDSPGDQREVQYFDKSRMEINDPTADANERWYVTNGLLPIEMISGRIQVGYETFEDAAPARVSAIGDPDTYPTYADLAPLYANPGADASDDAGQPVTRLLQPDGSIGRLERYRDDAATTLLEGSNGHSVPRAFLDFQNSQGIIYRNGQPVRDHVYSPGFVFGLPVTAAYWVNSRVAGKEQPVLFQVFERRVLTYNPSNPPGSRVEMGNVGQHFYRWRYGQSGPPPETADDGPQQAGQGQPAQISIFGMNTYITGLERIEQDREEGIERLVRLGREAGIEWAREELSWANLEPDTKGHWNWDYYDERLLQLAEAGYGIVGALQTTPGWARADDCNEREGRIADYWCPPQNAQDFADFVAAIVERYDSDGVDDAPGSPRVAVWQIWNEPSTRGTWPGSAAEYGALLAAAYRAAKTADPGALVITGGVYLYDGLGTDPNDGLPFLNAAMAAVPEAASSFDALAVHPYMPTSAPDAPIIFATITMWGRITNAQRWLEQNSAGSGTRPLWISEVGWSTCRADATGCNADVAKDEEQQANFLVRTYAIALALGVQHVSYFQLEDKFDGKSRIFWGEASVLGTKGEGYRPKPAYRAYQVMAQQLGGMTFRGFGGYNTFAYNPSIENPQDLYHLRFAGGDGVLVDVLWRNAGSQTIEFQLEGGHAAELITRDGSTTPLGGPAALVTVSEQPVYVRQSPD